MTLFHRRMIALFIFTGLFISCISACSTKSRQEQKEESFDIYAVSSYREIPGVTDEDVERVEALKAKYGGFSYGSLLSTEAFKLPDGAYAGFAPLFCGLLSELFGVPFVLETPMWSVLKDGVDAKNIDFTGELTPTPERLQDYVMSYPIAERGIGVFTRDDFTKIESVSDLNGLRIGFFAGTITAGSILSLYSELGVDIVDVYDDQDALRKLSSGDIDVFIADAPEALVFGDGFTSYPNLFPLVYTSVSMSTANPELEPIISVVNKYIRAGGIDRLHNFYKEGNHEYAMMVFYEALDDAEKAYFDGVIASGVGIPIVFENDNYPICFFNEKENEFQGIALDVLAEITYMTGIEFANLTQRDEAWAVTLEKLSAGKAAMVSELLFTQERKDLFLWTQTPYAVNRYALVSRSDYPYLEAYQVVRTTVGVYRGSAREDTYNELFPNNDNVEYFDYQSEAFDALERGDIDLVMSTEYEFLTLSNYLEKPGYKINIMLNVTPAESFFGFNINYGVLRSIIDKAMEYVDTGRIEKEWVNRTFNYERKMADERSYYANQRALMLFIFAVALLLLLVIMSLLFIRDRRKQKTIENRDHLLDTANQAAGILIESVGDSFDDDLRRCMGMLGKAVDSDRVCIWKNHVRDGRLYCTQIYEWLGDAESQINTDLTTDVSYDDTILGWEETLSRGDCVISLVRNLTREEQAQLSPQKILSLLVAPVFVRGEFWGYVGFDNCHEERLYSEWEQSILRSGSLMITNAIVNHEIKQSYMETATQLAAVISNYPGIIWSVDSDGIATLFNGSYMSFLGLLPENVVGKTLDEMADDPQLAESVSHVQRAYSEKQRQEWSTMKNGNVFRERALPILDENGDMLYLVGSMDDVTEMVRLQRELEEAIKTAMAASTAKSDFLARMSHEIRTPMNAIIGMTELALRENKMEAAREHLFTVKQSGTNLLSIINDILDFSKIEQGKVNIVESEYSVSSLLNDVISIIRMRLVDSQIRFAVNIDSNIPNSLVGDESRIRQILINLLGNAVKYTDKGYVSLTVCGEVISDEAINLAMEVKDTGKGIKQEDIKQIFDNYMQSDREKNRSIEGVGLGLAITNSLVNEMNGTIDVHSEYGTGSVFSVAIPQKIHERSKLALVENPGEQGVLVYERHDIYAQSITYALENLGVPFVLVKNDADFLNKLKSGSWKFAFLSFALLKKNMYFITGSDIKTKFVLLAEFGEPIPEGDWSVIATPVHVISVANTLNGEPDSYSFNAGAETNARFTAPNARVLVVDDINTNLIVAEGLLLPYQMQVDLCKSGFEAIEAVKNGHYDIVFMDHKMPEMDGVETTKRIRGMGGYYADIPIIALTANAVSGMREMFLENGFDDFISKPIDTVKLNSILENYIHKRRKNSSAELETSGAPVSRGIPAVFQIDDVDTQKGIMRSGGSVALYKRTLDAFITDGREKIPAITECIDKGNISLYTTHVHALKSAAAYIGADVCSETAKELELAGENNDAGFILAHTKKFLADLELLIEKINSALLQYGDK